MKRTFPKKTSVNVERSDDLSTGGFDLREDKLVVQKEKEVMRK